MGGAIFIPAIILHIILFNLLKYYSFNLKKKDKKNNISDLSDNLTKLGELKEKGILTDEEFNEQKKKLLKLISTKWEKYYITSITIEL